MLDTGNLKFSSLNTPSFGVAQIFSYAPVIPLALKIYYELTYISKPRKIQLRARTSRRDSCAVQAPPLALIWFTAIFRGAHK